MSEARIPDEIITPDGERLFPTLTAEGAIVWLTPAEIVGGVDARGRPRADPRMQAFQDMREALAGSPSLADLLRHARYRGYRP